MSWLKGVKDAAGTSKYKGYATGGGVKPETVSADPNATKVAGPKAAPFVKPMGGAAKPVFGKAGKKAFKTGGAVKKAPGGGVDTDYKEPDDREGVSDYLRGRQSEEKRDGNSGTGPAVVTGIGGALASAGKRAITKAGGAGLVGAGLYGIADAFKSANKTDRFRNAADRFKKLDMPDLPERKSGGKVSKKACGGSSGGERRLKAQENKEPL